MNKFSVLQAATLTCCALLGAIPVVHAATINISPKESSVHIGDLVSLDLTMNFQGEPTIGGGIDVLFDNFTNAELAFDSYTRANLGDAAFGRAPDVEATKLNGIAFGDFAGVSGPALIGTLSFKAKKAGDYFLDLAINDKPAGSFFKLNGDPQLPILNGATLHVLAVPIPIPAAVWLMFSALGTIGGVSSRRGSNRT